MLSAAQCFKTVKNGGVPTNEESDTKVIVGQYNRDVMTKDNHYLSQTLDIFHIEIPVDSLYSNGYYNGDIAILSLKEAIIYRNHIAKACLNFNALTLMEKLLPADDTYGLVAGFGINEERTPNKYLHKMSYPIVNYEKCRVLSHSFISFLSYDNFCAGYNNGRDAFCREDTGAGFVIKNKETNTYFVHGIFSNISCIKYV